jgi:uncharacterized protein YodC (DUF2158 family)
MSHEYKVSDVVFLKSGSPPMTVSDLARTDGLITVEWFDGATLHRDCFHPEQLCLAMPVDQIAWVKQL